MADQFWSNTGRPVGVVLDPRSPVSLRQFVLARVDGSPARVRARSREQSVEINRRCKRLYAEALALLNDMETVASRQPGVSGAVLLDWLAGEPLPPGADSFLLPEHAALGQAVMELRRLSQRLALLAALGVAVDGHPQEL
jgi:hypothetical protein